MNFNVTVDPLTTTYSNIDLKFQIVLSYVERYQCSFDFPIHDIFCNLSLPYIIGQCKSELSSLLENSSKFKQQNDKNFHEQYNFV